METSQSGLNENLQTSGEGSVSQLAGQETPETETPLVDPEVVNLWAMTRLAHEGMMLDKIQRQSRIVEDSVKHLQKEAGISTEEPEPQGDEESEQMGVSIGNKVTHQHYYSQKTENETTAGSNGGLKAAILGLAASALLGPAAGVATHWFLSEDEPAETTPSTDTTSDVTPGFGVPEWRHQ